MLTDWAMLRRGLANIATESATLVSHMIVGIRLGDVIVNILCQRRALGTIEFTTYGRVLLNFTFQIRVHTPA